MINDLRDFLAQIEQRGDLVRVKEHITDGHELFTIMWELSKRANPPVVIFENVKDYKLPIVSNVFGSMNRFGMAGRFPENQSYKFYRDIFTKRLTEKDKWLKPVTVATGPVKEMIFKGEEVNLYDLPIMQWHPHDGGPYITLPVEVTHLSQYGTNLGVYRMMVHDKKSTGLMCNIFQDIGAHLKKAKQMGMSSLPCSVFIGADPGLYLAAVTKMPFLDDEYEFAGALRGSPVEVVKCETNDLLVPAHAEIVLEGEISTSETKTEGPFGEFMGFREECMLLNLFKVNCITRRRDAYYMMTIVGPQLGEEENLTITLHNANFAVAARERITGFVDCWLPGAGRTALAVISIKKGLPGWGKQAIYQAFSLPYTATMMNGVIIVDEDIDPSNIKEVLWAMQTRVDPKTDIDLIKGCLSTPVDPAMPPDKRAARDHTSSRAIFYAVRPFVWKDKFPKVSRTGRDLRKEMVEKYKDIFPLKRL